MIGKTREIGDKEEKLQTAALSYLQYGQYNVCWGTIKIKCKQILADSMYSNES